MTGAIKLIAEKAILVRSAGQSSVEPVPSPCISVCRMNAQSALCEGCFRTLDEIAAWSRLDDASKRALWALIEQRLESVT